MFSAQPQPTTRSASLISSRPAAWRSRRRRRATTGCRGTGPWPRPRWPAARRRRRPAPSSSARRAPGRRARRRRPAAARAASSVGQPRDVAPRRSGRGPARRAARSASRSDDAAGTVQGLHVERQVEQDRRAGPATALATAAAAWSRHRRRRVDPHATRRRPPRPAPAGRRGSSERGWVASAARTTSGVRLLAASVMPVIALVSPQPWCTLTRGRPGRSRGRRRRPSSRRRPRAARRRTARRRRLSALVTWKLPLPTTPKTWSTPSRARRGRPPRRRSRGRLTLSARPAPARASGCPSRRRSAAARRRTAPVGGQLVEVLQLGQAVLARAEQERVAGERRVERVRGAGVGADRLDAEPEDRRLLGQPAGALDARRRACAGRSRRR